MNHETAVSNAKDIADRVLAPAARQNDKEARFSSEAVKALGPAGLLGIMLPAETGGAALGPRTFAAIVSALAEADASVAMVYLMHVCATATIAAARKGATVAPTLQEIAAGRHLSTLAFSEGGSRSHFWAPVSRAKRNGAGVHITAQKSFVTSAGHAQSYVVSALSPDGTGATDFDALSHSHGRPRTLGCGSLGRAGLARQRFRADDARRLRSRAGIPIDGRQRRLPGHVASGAAAVQPRLRGGGARDLPRRRRRDGSASQQRPLRAHGPKPCRSAWLQEARARRKPADIADGLWARIDDVVDHLEHPRETTMLRVLESKAAAGDTAIAVTSAAMRACGGAAFAKHMAIERLFRDAHAGAVMAPTGDVLREFIGKAVLGLPLF